MLDIIITNVDIQEKMACIDKIFGSPKILHSSLRNRIHVWTEVPNIVSEIAFPETLSEATILQSCNALSKLKILLRGWQSSAH